MDPAIQQLARGYFLDILFDCPYEMHELTADAALSETLRRLKEDHKEIFYFLAIRYYEDYESLDEETRDLYRLGMAAFDGIASSYHIELREKPTLVWDFHSLLLAIQMLFSFMLSDEKNTLTLCPNCKKVFPANRPNMVFCSVSCRTEYNAKRRNGQDEG